jgi:hypothetical protein
MGRYVINGDVITLNKYNIVVSATNKFKRRLRVFLNSFYLYHQKHLDRFKIHILNHDLPVDFLKTVPCYLEHGMDIVIRPIDHILEHLQGIDEKTRNVYNSIGSRFLYTSKLNGIVGVFDADSFFMDSILPWYDMATLGYIIGAGTGRNLVFGKGHNCNLKVPCHFYPLPEGMEEIEGIKDTKSIIHPVILDMDRYKNLYLEVAVRFEKGLTKYINEGEKEKYIHDWWLYNALFMYCDLLDKIIVLPPHILSSYQFNLMMPSTRVVKDEGKLVCVDGTTPVLVHGKWGDTEKTFCKNQAPDKANIQILDYPGAIEESMQLVSEEYERHLRGEYINGLPNLEEK